MKPKNNPSRATSMPRITLEQWRCLVAVVDAGGYAQAAEMLNKSQSSVTYAVQKLQSSLRVRAFEMQGRKAVLTQTGQMLYRRGRALLDEAGSIERAAKKLAAGWEAEITLAIEVLFPTWLMLDCLRRFGEESPLTRIEWFETVIGGTRELLESGEVDLGITPRVPEGFFAELLMPITFVPVAHPDHPLHRLGRELTPRDLRAHRHVIVRDSSRTRDKRSATIETEQRWTVSNMATSIGALTRGYGFAWMPVEKIQAELDSGLLRPLPLRGTPSLTRDLYLVFRDRDAIGPATQRLAQIVKEEVERRGWK